MLLDGTDQSEEADLIRDDCDDCWREMTPHAQERIRQLSIDLYVFSDGVLLERFDPCI
jgi:hypothetical protein